MEYKQFRDTPYWVSNDGSILSYHKRWKGAGRPVKNRLNDRGYWVTQISLNGVAIDIRIHQLVMEVWGPPKPDAIENWVIDHIDENPANSNISNLRWLTYGDNIRRGHRKRRKFSDAQEAEILRRYEAGEGTCIVLGKVFGCAPMTISKAMKRARARTVTSNMD